MTIKHYFVPLHRLTFYEEMRKITLLFALLLFWLSGFAQQGGMWLPSLLEGMNAKEMKSLGMKMSVKDIYEVNKSSLKDAVPHFNGGCTAEMISNKGLLLTNHHCGYSQIQSHSTLANDYLTYGFWAKKQEEELPNENLRVTFIVRVEDITSKVLVDTEALVNEEARTAKIESNINNVLRNTPKEAWQECRVRAFYEGNQYLLFIVETFKDVRLVGAPPSSIGKFGSDTDNWVWPRHTGDFALFRVYADKNNRPAAYSKDNVPYKPKHYFPISLKGVKEGDFTMVFGYPGRTQEYLPAIAVAQMADVINPMKIGIRDVILKTQDSFMRNDPEIKIKYASKYASIANYWKKWIGEAQGLKKSGAVAIKQKQEEEFKKDIESHSRKAEYGTVLPEMEKLYAQALDYSVASDLFSEFMRHIDLLNNGYKIMQLQNVLLQRGEEAFNEKKAELLQSFKTSYKNYDKTVDKAVFEKAVAYYAKNMPKRFLAPNLQNFNAKLLTGKLYNNSFLASYEGIEKTLQLPESAFKGILKKDVGMQFIQQIVEYYFVEVASPYQEITDKLAGLQRKYMKGILEFATPEDRIFPDANSTLRVTYGKVEGYSPADAVKYEPFTYLDGVMEKYIPNDYEFDVPAKLRYLYERKEYGIYGKDGKMPVCFIATNHTTGGNSGSPAIDAKGNLIGLNFDRVWEGTMSDVYYDPKICRNIMVDIRYILFIIDKYADASYLIDEMKIIK